MIVIVSERPNPMRNSKLFKWLVNQNAKYLKKHYSECIRNGLFHIGSEYYRAMIYKKTGEVFDRADYERSGGQMYAIIHKYRRYKRRAAAKMREIIVSELHPTLHKYFSWMIEQSMEYLKKEYSNCIRKNLWSVAEDYFRAMLWKKTQKVFPKTTFHNRNGELIAFTHVYNGG